MNVFWCDIRPWLEDPGPYLACCAKGCIPLEDYLQVRDSIPHVVGQTMIRQLWPREKGPFPGLTQGPRGKPRFPADGPHFNLSHAGRLVVLAAGTQSLGVDVEEIGPVDPALLDALCPPERHFLQTLPPAQQAPAFFRIWTRKESMLKARGQSLGHFFDLDAVVSGDGLWADAVPGGFLRDLEILPGYAAAVCCAAPEAFHLQERTLDQLAAILSRGAEPLF